MKLAVISLTFLALYFCEHVYAPTPEGDGYVYLIAEYNEKGKLTRYFKVGGTGEENRNTRRNNLNTGNPRHLKVEYYEPVTRTKDAENDAHKDLIDWRVNMGGGKEWYYVPENQFETFIIKFFHAIRKYRPNGCVVC